MQPKEIYNSIMTMTSYDECNLVYSTLLDFISDGVYITDGNGITLRVNQAYQKMTGIMEEEVIGRSMNELISSGFFTRSVTLDVLKKKHQTTITSQVRTGKEFLITGRPIFNREGTIVRVITTLRDMEELNSLRQRLQKSREESERYQKELSYLRMQQLKIDEIVMKSLSMKKAVETAISVGEVQSTVLITGESGVGKGVIAKIVHYSANKDKPFIKINCGAIPETLLESELFGYTGGAFTGADKKGKPGFFEIANGGTLFLDEIAELPFYIQAKLLHAIQEKEIYRVGSTRPIKINVRIIAATNQDLERMLKKKKFREDLYYRLSVIPIYIPPLRERQEDILPLIQSAVKRCNKMFGKEKVLSPQTIKHLENYHWPGNVRELENNIERLIVISRGKEITPEDLPPHILEKDNYQANEFNATKNRTLSSIIDSVEKTILQKACIEYKTTRQMAEALGISQPTVVRKMKQYGLN